MIKNIEWLYCEKCNHSPIKIKSNVEHSNNDICYEGDDAECENCGNKGVIYIETFDNTAHIEWTK